MIVGLLSFYNESPAMLAACSRSLAPMIDHLIAVDGPYALYPDSSPTSPADQASTIRDVCQAHGIGVTIHQPPHPWAGNEIEKRTFMFRLAETITSEDDWYYIADADEQVTHLHADPRTELASTHLDAAEVTYWWHRPQRPPSDLPFATPLREQQGITKFFRAIRGLRCDGTHYRYVTPDGRILWNGSSPCEPTHDLRAIRVQHRNQERDLWRQQEAADYYKRRDLNRIEQVPA